MKKKILVKINVESDFSCFCDGYIIGLSNFSFGFEKSYDLSEVRKIVKKTKKEVFVSLNKTIYNWELNEYKKALLALDTLNLSGIIIGDVAGLTYGLKTNLILDQSHLNNASLSVNHYYNNGASGVVLTNDITMEETNLIASKTKALLFKLAFGLPHLSSSSRMLISNYLEYFNKKDNSDHYFIRESKKDDYYIVKEDKTGTYVFSCHPLNLLSVIDDVNVDYLILDSYLLKKEDFNLVTKAFYEHDLSLNDKINETYDASLGFINKKTIYKVKNDE